MAPGAGLCKYRNNRVFEGRWIGSVQKTSRTHAQGDIPQIIHSLQVRRQPLFIMLPHSSGLLSTWVRWCGKKRPSRKEILIRVEVPRSEDRKRSRRAYNATNANHDRL